MRPLSNDPPLAKTAGELALDGRALDALKREAGRDPQGAVKKAAQQFEALFMQRVLKSMRDATPKSGLLDSTAAEMYTGLLDQQLAGKVAASGTGLAELIARQLSRHMESGVGSRESGAKTAPAAAASQGQPSHFPRPTPNSPLASADSRLPTPDSEQRDFVTKVWDHALSAERATGVPAKFIVGQAALESGWGRREIRGTDGLPSYNLFGIKANASWKGRTVEVVTTEYEGGVAGKVVEKFRAYNNYSESFRDWARLMASQPRYAPVLAQGRNAQDVSGFASALQRAGYATDPAYGAKLTRLINTTLALRGAA